MKLARARFAAGVAAILLFSATGMVRADAGQPLLLGQVNRAITETAIEVPSGTALRLRSPCCDDTRVNIGLDVVGFDIGVKAYGDVGVSGVGETFGLSGHGGIGVIAKGANDGVVAIGGFLGVDATGQIGVRATGTEVAIEVNGPATFSRSGTVTLTSPAKSAVVSGVPVTARSMVLATAQSQAGVWVSSAVPHVRSGDGFTIYLNKPLAAGKSVVVAWFVLN